MGQARDEAGNIWETDAQGNPTRLLQAAGSAPQMPADPSFPYQGAQAQAQAANTGAQAAVNSATIPAQITAANADATSKTRTAQTAGLPEGFMWGPDGKTAVPIPGYSRQGLSPEIRSQAIQTFTDADALERAANDIEQRFKDGPGATSGILESLRDYLPLTENKLFNDAGQQARGYVKRALGFTGGEGNTVSESSALYDPYLPNSWDTDEQIVAKIEKLRQLAQDARQRASTTLGGVPDTNGNIVPQFNALTMPRVIDGGSGTTAAAAGSETGAFQVDPAYQQEYTAWVTQNAGRFTPEQYAQFRSGLDQKFGYQPVGGADYTQEGQRLLEGFQRGGSQNLTIPPYERPLTGGAFSEQARNNAVNNPVGAAAVGFADMAGFGGVSALAGDQMNAMSQAQPVGTALGQIGGAITGTGALGALGRNTAGRALPRLVGGGGGSQFARNVGTDAAYSGIYGGMTGDDPLMSAGLGAVGSVGGQGIGRLGGAAIGGVASSPASQYLASRNIPQTVGQRLGGFAKNIEDKAMSVPLVGDMIRNRRVDGLNAFNREAFTEAGAPIGASVQDIGQEGVQQLTDEVGNAYDAATSGAPPVPLDPQFMAELQQIIARGQSLPDDLRAKLQSVLDTRLAPATDSGTLDGYGFQQATRGLKASRSAADRVLPGFEDIYRDTLTDAMDALEGQMMRGGSGNVVAGLKSANAANRNMRTIEDATNRAMGGSETGTPFMFTPSQLQRAGKKTEQRFPGPRPFAELADNGQEVLPSRLPNSGTADRLMQAALPAGILGGAGVGAWQGGDLQGAGTGAGLSTLAAAALLLGGTRGGQAGLNAALFSRPAQAKILGNAIKRRSGLFGSATLPALIADY